MNDDRLHRKSAPPDHNRLIRLTEILIGLLFVLAVLYLVR